MLNSQPGLKPTCTCTVHVWPLSSNLIALSSFKNKKNRRKLETGKCTCTCRFEASSGISTSYTPLSSRCLEAQMVRYIHVFRFHFIYTYVGLLCGSVSIILLLRYYPNLLSDFLYLSSFPLQFWYPTYPFLFFNLLLFLLWF